MSPAVRTVLLCALAAAGYAASAQAFGPFAEAVLDLPCDHGAFNVTCRLPEDGGLNREVYGASALGAAAAWGGTALLARRRLVYPFVALFCLLGLGAMAYDLAFENRLVAGAKLANDTFNVLRFVIFASFVLTFLLVRWTPPSLARAAAAIAVSYAGALVFTTAFLALRGAVMGAFELLLLYGAYAFGGFTVHLMTVSLMVTAIDTEPSQPA